MASETRISELLLKCNDIKVTGAHQPYLEEFLEISASNPRDNVTEYRKTLSGLSTEQVSAFLRELEDEEILETVNEHSLVLLFFRTSHYFPIELRQDVYATYVSVSIAFKLVAAITTFLLLDANEFKRRALKNALRSASRKMGIDPSSFLPPVDQGYDPEEYARKFQLFRSLGGIILSETVESKTIPFIVDYIVAGVQESTVTTSLSDSVRTLEGPEMVEKLAEFWDQLMPERCRQRLRIIHLDSKLNSVAKKNAKRALAFLGEIVMDENTSNRIEVTIGDGNTFYGDMVVAKSIQDSFNKASNAAKTEDLKQILEDLSVAVAKMVENLPDDEAKRAARALDTVVEEATSDNPNREW